MKKNSVECAGQQVNADVRVIAATNRNLHDLSSKANSDWIFFTD